MKNVQERIIRTLRTNVEVVQVLRLFFYVYLSVFLNREKNTCKYGDDNVPPRECDMICGGVKKLKPQTNWGLHIYIYIIFNNWNY